MKNWIVSVTNQDGTETNDAKLQAVSENDAVRVYADRSGYKTVAEPDMSPMDTEWIDSDGTLYWVVRDENQDLEDQLQKDIDTMLT
jgi:hypothetical protein